MLPKRFAIVCAGQGQQASLDFDGLRPSAQDHKDYQGVWEGFSAEVGQDFADHWNTLSLDQRNLNRYAQLSVVAWQVLHYLRHRSTCPRPDWVLGYSVGELSALAIAGSLPMDRLAHWVALRAQLMDAAMPNPEGVSCLILLSERLPPASRTRRQLCLDQLGLQCAIRRSSSESIWGGPANQVSAFLERAAQEGWNARSIDVKVPSHTRYLNSALPLWLDALQSSVIHDPDTGVLAGISAEPIRTSSRVCWALSQQLVQTIRWDDCLEAMLEHGVNQVWDLGPGQDQTRLIKERNPEMDFVEI